MIKTDLKPNTGMHIMLPVFTWIKIFMRKNYKKSISFRQAVLNLDPRRETVSQRKRNQSLPNLASPSFLRLFNCFSTSSFHVSCSSVLPSRVKMRIFTLIELLIVIAIICIL